MKHFVKILATFTAMIALGMVGIYLVNMYGKDEGTRAGTETPTAEATVEVGE
ncbi:MAG: hypothetical protein WCT29_03385 [Candidatus Paceibacterota bacterium]|jgi:hypothetical protein